MSDFRSEDRNNSADKQFAGIPVGSGEAGLLASFLDSHDFSLNSRKAISCDIKKFARWFTEANKESFVVARVTTRDVTDFKDHLRRHQGQAVSTVNRSLVTVRRFFGWLVDEGTVPTNPAKPVNELKRQQLAPKGLERKDVRRLFRELELRQDIRANGVFHLFLYTGCRVGGVAALELGDLQLSERS